MSISKKPLENLSESKIGSDNITYGAERIVFGGNMHITEQVEKGGFTLQDKFQVR